MKFIGVDASNQSVILELFSKSLDKDGFIIEKKTDKRLICPYSNTPIKGDNFSILPGSATFVNNNFFCFSEHIARHR